MVARGVRGRSWLAVFGVLGLVGSLLAVGAGPAGGVEGEADNEAVYSACVGAALESAGLLDVVGSFAEDAVNCLAHFGVTRGRTATMYDPGSPVLRWQMALFLSRAAGPAGIALPANPVAVFTDVGGLFEEARTAVNQMAALDIMPALRGTSFGPNTAVSRAQMALMLDAFLVAAEKGAGLGLGALGADADALADVVPDDEVFDDIANVTRGEYSAIRRMFELGVARGTADDRFSPGGLVTRAQMAVFITRMLAHTVARPRGITLQASETSATEGDSVDLVVSVRDSDLLPMPDALVDVFSSSAPGDAFGEDGRCSADDVSAVGGSGVCEISLGDQTTDPSGDLELSTESLDASTTLWAWTGDNGDRYDADDMVGASIAIAVSKAGTKLRVTDDMPEGATAAEFGERVAFTLQVVDEDGNPVAKKDESVTVVAAETVSTAGDDSTTNTSSTTRSYKTDASGKIELTFRQTDPRSGSGNTGDSARLDLDITLASGSSLTLEDKTNLKKAGTDGDAAGDAAAVWYDSTPVATTLMLSQAVDYHEASGAGNGAANVVTATLTDQYGNPVARQRINFTSDDPDGIGAKADPSATLPACPSWRGVCPGRAVLSPTTALVFDISSDETRMLTGESRWTRTTNRRGVATLSYNRKSSDSGIETILAETVVGSGADAVTIDADRAYHYWAAEPAVGGSAQGRIVAADTENNRLVIAGSDVTLVAYDSNDQFSTTVPVTMSAFEKYLDETAAHASVDDYQTRSQRVSHITVKPEWTGLDHPDGTDAGAAARFGQAVAADAGVLVVGAGHESVVQNGGTLSMAGKVYIYDEGITDDTPVVLMSPDPTAEALFGYDVDIAGGTVVVSEFAGSSAAGTKGNGMVYVYTKNSSGAWELDATFNDDNAPDLDPSDQTCCRDRAHQFGRGVAISRDGKWIGVAAPQDPRSAAPIGWVLLFEKPASAAAGEWDDSDGSDSIQLEPADSADGTVYTGMGADRSIALSRDGSTVVAGAAWVGPQAEPPLGLGWPNGHTGYGAGFVWVKPDGGWAASGTANNAVAKLTPAPVTGTRAAHQQIGKRADISADGNTVVLGGSWDAIDWQIGQALVYTKPSGGWVDDGDGDNSDQAKHEPTVLEPAGGRPADVFGQYVAVSADGSEVTASRHYRQEGDWRGSVMVYERSGNDWTLAAEYLGAKPQHHLGWATVYDKADDTLYTSWRFNDGDGGRLLTIFRIDR